MKLQYGAVYSLPILVLVLVASPAIYAQTTDDLDTEQPNVENPHILDPDDPIGPVGRADDLHAAHGDLTDIMREQSMGNFDTPDYPFVMTYVDEEHGDLVVMMHVMAAVADIEYDEEEIAVAIGHDVPIHITYGVAVAEVPQYRIDYWKQYYVDYCSPVKPGHQNVCKVFEQYLRDNGVNPDTLVPAPPTNSTTSPPTTPTTIPVTTSPCDDDADSLTCYYYKKYQEKCIPAKTTSRCDTYASLITGAGYKVPTSAPAKVTPPKVSNIKAVLSNGDVKVTWDKPQYEVERYRVYAYEDDRYKSREYVTTNSHTFDDAKPGKEYKFRVYVYYEKDDRLTGTYGGYAYSNTVSTPASIDRIPPVLQLPQNTTIRTNSTGAVINYTVTASDNIDGAITPECTPKSGSVFALGNATVSCTALDSSGNSASGAFVISVVRSNQSESQCTVPQTGSQSGLICDVFRYADRYSTMLRGGEPINVKGHSYDDAAMANVTGEKYGTMGLVIDYDGSDVIVTNSHVARPFETTQKIFTLGPLPLQEVAVGEIIRDTDVRSGGIHKADAALIHVTNPQAAVQKERIQYDGEILNVTSFGGVYDLAAYHRVHIAGTHSDGEGFTQYKNVTVALRAGDITGKTNSFTLTNQVSASYSSTGGDSGAPIFIDHKNGTAQMLGIHAAKTCALTLDNNVFISLVKITPENIADPCTTANSLFGIFTTWESIVEELGLD